VGVVVVFEIMVVDALLQLSTTGPKLDTVQSTGLNSRNNKDKAGRSKKAAISIRLMLLFIR
jgi:hypothetical protein